MARTESGGDCAHGHMLTICHGKANSIQAEAAIQRDEAARGGHCVHGHVPSAAHDETKTMCHNDGDRRHTRPLSNRSISSVLLETCKAGKTLPRDTKPSPRSPKAYTCGLAAPAASRTRETALVPSPKHMHLLIKAQHTNGRRIYGRLPTTVGWTPGP